MMSAPSCASRTAWLRPWPRAAPVIGQYHRTAHQHVEITLGEWAHAQPGLNDFDAMLLAQTAAAIMITAFYTWRPDDPADLLPQLVRRGFDRVAEGL
jgi:hypothetical protein